MSDDDDANTTTTTPNNNNNNNNNKTKTNNKPAQIVIEKLFQKVESLKTEGNLHYETKHYTKADDCYSQALKVVSSLSNFIVSSSNQHDQNHKGDSNGGDTDTDTNGDSDDDVEMQQRLFNLLGALYTNRLLVLHKLKRYNDAEEFCNQALNHKHKDDQQQQQHDHDDDTSSSTTTARKLVNCNLREWPKVWYRRAIAREALKKYTLAEQDLVYCLTLLKNDNNNNNNSNNRNQTTTTTATINGVKTRLVLINDTESSLIRIQNMIQKMDISDDDDDDDGGGGGIITSNGHNDEKPTTSSTQSTYNNSHTDEKMNGVRISKSISNVTPKQAEPQTQPQEQLKEILKKPSPTQQKQIIIQLLSQSPVQNEGYFMIHYQWWTIWCRHVNFFLDYEYYKEQEQMKKKDNMVILGQQQGEGDHGQQQQQRQQGQQQQNESILKIQSLEKQRYKILNLLPMGASLPKQDMEDITRRRNGRRGRRRRRENTKKRLRNTEDDYSDASSSSSSSSISSSSSSEDSSSDDDENEDMNIRNGDGSDGDGGLRLCQNKRKKYGRKPGVIDNSRLILDNDNDDDDSLIDSQIGQCNDLFIKQWRHFGMKDYQYEDNEDDEDDEEKESEQFIHLRTNLVRGYHFEVLPREVYNALRCWYGEYTQPICRRATTLGGGGGDNNGLHIYLYPEIQPKWKNNNTNYADQGEDKGLCGACKQIGARKRCTNCKAVFYCGKHCQSSHWNYHKATCKILARNKRNQGNGIVVVVEPKRIKSVLSDDPKWGRVGLNNLGNTCFMNSALQCISHSAPLTRHFLTDSFKKDLNISNPLGTRGELAKAYEIVVKELWMGGQKYRSMSPTALKRAIAKFAPRFAGVSQHDSQEFLAFLLDGLHEDLNKIQHKPYVEKADVTNGENLSIAGAKAWDTHCLRNKSLVMDTFYGQFKSTCVCPKCERTSVSFDVFNHVSLEIPQQREITMTVSVLLIRAVTSDGPAYPPTRYGVTIATNGYMRDLKSKLAQLCGVPHTCLALCDLFERTISDLYADDKKVLATIGRDDLVLAYEIHPYTNTTIHAVVSNVMKSQFNGRNTAEANQFIGYPLLTSFDVKLTCKQISEHIWRQFSHLIKVSPTNVQKVKDMMSIHIFDNKGRPRPAFSKNTEGSQSALDASTLPLSNVPIIKYLGEDCVMSYLFIQIAWNLNTTSGNPNDNFVNFSDHPSFTEYLQQKPKSSHTYPTLDQCFENFTRPEHLDDNNKWYCSNCKEHVRAMKTMELWRLPNILIIHLKRFEYKHALRRDKLETFVDCPLENFNLSRHCASSSSNHSVNASTQTADFEVNDIPAVYDLFAVTNHYGRMGFGHYTAVARRWNEFEMDNDWAVFDDSSVSRVGSTSGIVTQAAYVLFYRRRSFT